MGKRINLQGTNFFKHYGWGDVTRLYSINWCSQHDPEQVIHGAQACNREDNKERAVGHAYDSTCL